MPDSLARGSATKGQPASDRTAANTCLAGCTARAEDARSTAGNWLVTVTWPSGIITWEALATLGRLDYFEGVERGITNYYDSSTIISDTAIGSVHFLRAS